MNGNRMPTLFEILNRFSKPPVDLWSFYVFLKEQYGGVEYLEFWLDCASYASISNQLNLEVRQSQLQQIQSPTLHGSHDSSDIFASVDPSNRANDLIEDHGSDSENSDNFDPIHDLHISHEPLNSGAHDGSAHNGADHMGNHMVNHTGTQNGDHISDNDGDTDVDIVGHGKQDTDTISRLSDMLHKMRSTSRLAEGGSVNGYQPTPINQYHADISEPRPASFPSHYSVTRKTMHESVHRIVSLYLTPGAEKEIDLPCDQNGWSIADDIRQTVNTEKGVDTPDLFSSATTYVFDVLEREALPAFLMHRALSNILPLSTTLRLAAGLLGLFGAFWLSFAFLLLNWEPIRVKCWVILPFFIGWYLTISALYRVDPVLVMLRRGERDGGGFLKIQEKFVYKMMVRRAIFVSTAVILMTAAFSVLFIFVPGYRL